MRKVGGRVGARDTISRIVAVIAAVNPTPTSVKPYAHAMRIHGHVSGLRQLRANESLSSLRKSSVIGLGSTAFHNSQSNHAATPMSISPHSETNATFIMPPR